MVDRVCSPAVLHLLPLPSCPSICARLDSNRRWIWGSATSDGCHSSWQAIIPVPVFLVPFSPSLSREKSVMISDIYSHDGSCGEHAYSIARRKGKWMNQRHQGIGSLFSLIAFVVTVFFFYSSLQSLSPPLPLKQTLRLEGRMCGWLGLSETSLFEEYWKIFLIRVLQCGIMVKRLNFWGHRRQSPTLISESSWLAGFTPNQQQS